MDKEWTGYQSANNGFALPVSTSSIPEEQYKTSSWQKEQTPFADIQEVCPNVQPNYDAMSSRWNGVVGESMHSIQKSQPSPTENTTSTK